MSIKVEQLDHWVTEVRDDVVQWRRHLHAHPELSFEEEKTSQFVYDTLNSFHAFELDRPTRTSVVARLHGTKPGPVVAVRADIDALPIVEENDFAFASRTPGVMHACGHDGHTAILLGVAKILSRLQEHLTGEVRLLFQHAEELYPGGARELVQAGVVDGVDAIIGAHLWTSLEVGKIGITVGPMMAAPDTFHIVIIGKGGHAGQPHLTVDSIAVAAQVVTNLQHIVSRNTDPFETLVVSVTQFVAGTTNNVIPGSAELVGTVRSFNPDLRRETPKLMERVIKGVAEAHGAAYRFTYNHGYRPVVNDARVTQRLRESMLEAFGPAAIVDNIRTMAGEDFSAYQSKIPGSFFFIGAGNPAKGIAYPHHHARFTVDEEALAIGVKAYLSGIFKLLEDGVKG
ncbi:amidohydrolase [Kyrpidia tusciae]|uniref:Amidohydrolase n=1 Tax=Kyrpidia tusciae (strain DSM 2912 / NBRC 15312 / T2) TaxID=562970 RepID=D5WWD3_KYRT2|nr:amidohydrolase [Kyrpidia tusciae DSM 2912]